MSYQPAPPEEPLVGEVRVRVPLPFFIPLVALAVIAVIAIGLSRVLLAVPAEAATVIALAMAANILGACAFVALKPRVGGATYMELLAIVIYPVLIGVVIAQVGIGAEAAHGSDSANEQHAPAPGDGGETVVADNVAFDTDEIQLTAGESLSLRFENADTLEHNISIYENQQDGLAFENAIFEGEIIGGGESITYEIDPPEPGEYYFHCDVHPNMNGTVTVQ